MNGSRAGVVGAIKVAAVTKGNLESKVLFSSDLETTLTAQPSNTEQSWNIDGRDHRSRHNTELLLVKDKFASYMGSNGSQTFIDEHSALKPRIHNNLSNISLVD